jgi:hypothetical protein
MPERLVIRALMPCEWPAADREAWEAACRPSQGLRRGGRAVHLKPVSRDDLMRRYGLFLDHVRRTGDLKLSASVASYVTPERVEGYLNELRSRVGSVTAYGYIAKLRRAAQILDPKSDLQWLAELEEELGWMMRPRPKQHRIVDSDRIVATGIKLMKEAEADIRSTPLSRALRYRNGLMIAFLALMPLRLKNFCALKIGLTILQVEGAFCVVLSANETKSKRSDERHVPLILQPYLATYLNVHRPVLGGKDEAALWMGYYGMPLSYAGCEQVIANTTRDAVGVSISAHLFRTCAASTAYLYAGDQPHLASGLLQHVDSRVTERHYNRAMGASFARSFSELVDSGGKKENG